MLGWSWATCTPPSPFLPRRPPRLESALPVRQHASAPLPCVRGFCDCQNVAVGWASSRNEPLSDREVHAGVLVWTADSAMGPIHRVTGHMAEEATTNDPHFAGCKAGNDLADQHAKLGALDHERPADFKGSSLGDVI
eukprot:955560-Pyramimonas_sp.AAC.1